MGKTRKQRQKESKRRERARTIAHAKATNAALPQQTKEKKRSLPEFIKELNEDVIRLMQAEIQVKKIIELRIRMAEEMQAKDPLHFNQLRVDSFKQLQERLVPLHDAVSALCHWVGELNGMTNMADQMVSIHEQMGSIMDAQLLFDGISKMLAQTDADFNKDVQDIMQAKHAAEGTEPGPDDEFDIQPLKFEPPKMECEQTETTEAAPMEDSGVTVEPVLEDLPTEESPAEEAPMEDDSKRNAEVDMPVSAEDIQAAQTQAEAPAEEELSQPESTESQESK